MSSVPFFGYAAGVDGRNFYRPGDGGREPFVSPADERFNLWLWLLRVRLRMNERATIQIIGSPVACADGVKDSWRELAGWIAGKLRERYGTASGWAGRSILVGTNLGYSYSRSPFARAKRTNAARLRKSNFSIPRAR